jgi:serine phosphatase RsbU (regulator of sigma subunit)
LQAAILAALEDFTRGARQADDLTLLLLRYHGAAQAAKALAGST